MYGRGSTGSRCVERRCLVHSPFHSFFTFASLFQCFLFFVFFLYHTILFFLDCTAEPFPDFTSD